MKYLLLGLFILTSFPLLAAECVVISGAKKDHNGAFKARALLNPKTSMINGKPCRVLNSWKELETVKFKEGSEVLVVLGAHGGSEKDANGLEKVSFSCNMDDPTADDILKGLEKISKTHRVGAVIHSCYSGEIMRKKLMKDHTNSALADKLCLYTSSSPGRISFSRETDPITLLEKAKPGYTLEKMFMDTDAGMISSAAWEEVGVPQYLISKNLTEGLSAINGMDGIVRAPAQCVTEGEINSALCMAPGVTDEIYKDLMNLNDPVIPNKSKGTLVSTYTILLSLFSDGLSMNPKNQIMKDGLVCHEGLVAAYKLKFGEKLENLGNWKELQDFMKEIKTKKLYPACVAYLKSNNPKVAVDEGKLNELLMGDMYSGYQQYQKSLESLKKKYTKTNWDEFDPAKFAQASAGDKRVCKPESKQKIIQSLFGESFFEGDYFSNFEGTLSAPAEVAPERKINTQHMMKAFQNACMVKEDMPNAIDAKRRKACADFKL